MRKTLRLEVVVSGGCGDFLRVVRIQDDCLIGYLLRDFGEENWKFDPHTDNEETQLDKETLLAIVDLIDYKQSQEVEN